MPRSTKLSVTANDGIVPVLMFHSVGIGDHPWVWADMSEEIESFRQILSGLKRSGFTTVGLNELYGYMQGTHRLPGKSVVLTFDDGYLDNWIYVAPLLQKYEMKGVVYVTPEFVEPSGPRREMATFGDNGKLIMDNRTKAGFMNWDELRYLDSQGILDVQSHALTHTWYFSSGTIKDVHRRQNIYPYPWMSWNVRPDRKPYYLNEDQQHMVPWGSPILEHAKSLVVRRYFPDESAIEELVEFTNQEGFGDEIDPNEWFERARSRFPAYFAENGVPGNHETVDEYAQRVEYELTSSKKIIEEQLNKKVEFLSWPGGGVNDIAADRARQAGYKSWTLSSWQEPDRRNLPGVDAEGIKRISGRGETYWKGQAIADKGAEWVLRRVRIHQGSLVSRILNLLARLASVARTSRREKPAAETV